MKQNLKTLGFAVTFIGLLLNAANLNGYLVDSERVKFAKLVETSEEVPDSTAGFSKFLAAFAPPRGFDASSITGISSYRLQSVEGYNVFGNVSYAIGEKRSAPVATFEEVRVWSKETHYGGISWSITAVGLLISVGVEYRDRLEKRRAV